MNPFIQNFKLNVVKINTSYFETKTTNISDGIVGKYKKVEESYLAEQQDKTSVYHIPYIENILFKELKSSGRDLLLYIIYNIQKDDDTINLSADKLYKEMSISKSTYYTAISQLIDVGIICKKNNSTYWVNPFYIFKGNRIDYYHKHCPDCVNVVAEVKK